MPVQPGGEIITYHASMLRDETRTEAFRRAIQATVREGDIVCDLGTGTGILALFAVRAGARRVFAIEEGPVSALAREVLAVNDPEGVVELVAGHSSEIILPERADVLISETLWNFGLGEGIVQAVRDARKNILSEEARFVPQRFHMLLAPVESQKPYRIIDTWSEDRYGLDLTPVRRIASNVVVSASLAEEEVLADPARFGTIELGGDDVDELRASLEFKARREGTLYGLGGWFEAELAPGIDLTNAPPNAARNWAQAFLSLGEPLEVATGDVIGVEIWATLSPEQWRWSVRVGDREQRGSTFGGLLISLADLHRTAPGRTPKLSPRGQAVAELLAHLDGTVRVADLVPRLRERHPDLFPNDAAADKLVREVLERWT